MNISDEDRAFVELVEAQGDCLETQRVIFHLICTGEIS